MHVNDHKAALLNQWREELEERLRILKASQEAARAGTRVDGSHRPENRGERGAVTSQGYLAQGLQQQIGLLQDSMRILGDMGAGPRTRVVMGAWFVLETEAGKQRQMALLPGGDATLVELGEQSVQVLSPGAPLIQPLLGLEAGEGAELRGLGEVEILEIW